MYSPCWTEQVKACTIKEPSFDSVYEVRQQPAVVWHSTALSLPLSPSCNCRSAIVIKDSGGWEASISKCSRQTFFVPAVMWSVQGFFSAGTTGSSSGSGKVPLSNQIAKSYAAINSFYHSWQDRAEHGLTLATRYIQTHRTRRTPNPFKTLCPSSRSSPGQPIIRRLDIPKGWNLPQVRAPTSVVMQ